MANIGEISFKYDREKVGKVLKHYVKEKHLKEFELWRQTAKGENIQGKTVHRFCKEVILKTNTHSFRNSGALHKCVQSVETPAKR